MASHREATAPITTDPPDELPSNRALLVALLLFALGHLVFGGGSLDASSGSSERAATTAVAVDRGL